MNHSNIRKSTAWVHKGGVVGRGVLLDFATWSDKHQIAIDPMTSVGITVEQLKAVAEEQGVKFLPGDILFVRTGFTRAYERLSREEEREISQRAEPNFIGIEASCDMLRWLWDQSFAAIAGDQPAMEQCPLGVKSNGEYMIHEWCLAGWGMPIGEMFYLEELAETCKTLNRYSFFISSMPFNVSAVLWLCANYANRLSGPWRCCQPSQCSCSLLAHRSFLCKLEIDAFFRISPVYSTES